MTYQQWQSVARWLQSQGFNQQMIISMIGPPPAAPSGSPYGYGYGSGGGYPYSMGGGLDPMQQMLMALLGPSAIRATKAPYDLQMQAAKMGVNNPEAIASMINRVTRQLSPQLVQSVTRNVMPSIAARGLATSGPMTEQIVGEALAPYQMQEQQMAQQQVLSGLQAPFSVGSGLAGQYPESLIDYGMMVGATPSNPFAP